MFAFCAYAGVFVSMYLQSIERLRILKLSTIQTCIWLWFFLKKNDSNLLQDCRSSCLKIKSYFHLALCNSLKAPLSWQNLLWVQPQTFSHRLYWLNICLVISAGPGLRRMNPKGGSQYQQFFQQLLRAFEKKGPSVMVHVF